MGFSRPEYWRGLPFSSAGDLSNPGIEPRSPALRVGSLSAEPPGKPRNTGVGSLSLLQGIFPTQESNQGLLHCRRILYQLSYQGNPNISLADHKILALIIQLCQTLYDPMAYSQPGSSVQRILQARILEWIATSFFKGSSQSQDRTCIAGRFFVF